MNPTDALRARRDDLRCRRARAIRKRDTRAQHKREAELREATTALLRAEIAERMG